MQMNGRIRILLQDKKANLCEKNRRDGFRKKSDCTMYSRNPACCLPEDLSKPK
jgi:hypothetical protein